MSSRLGAVFLVLFSGWPAGILAQRIVDPPAPILLLSGSGATQFTLLNQDPSPIAIELKLGLTLDANSQARLNQPLVTFTMESGGGPLPKQLERDHPLRVVMNVSGLTAASVAALKVFNKDKELGTFAAVAIDDPISVAISGEGTSDKPLVAQLGKPAVITLKNSSSETLSLDWSFHVRGDEQGHGNIRFTPGGVALLTVPLKYTAYSREDSIRPGLQNGRLVLRLHASPGVASDLLPMKTLNISLTMLTSGASSMTLKSYAFVAILLAIGASLSGSITVIQRQVIPTLLRKIELEDTFREMAGRSSSVSVRVDSYVRVLLRLDRIRISAIVNEVSPFSVSASSDLDQAFEEIARFERRLVVAERVDALRRTLEENATTAPPSFTEAIDHALRKGEERVHSFVLSDEDVLAAIEELNKVGVSQRELQNTEVIKKRIVADLTELQARTRELSESSRAILQSRFPALSEGFQQSWGDPENLSPTMFFVVDHGITVANIAIDYALVRAAAEPYANSEVPKGDRLARLNAHEEELLQLLGTLSWKALHDAHILLQQMREDIYEEDVLQHLSARGARIVQDTNRARAYLPVSLFIAFDDPRFNNSAALERLSFLWTFPRNMFEEGWKVCHYFDVKGGTGNVERAAISLSVTSPRVSQAVQMVSQIEVSLSPRARNYSRALAEGLSFLLAIGVTLATLEVGGLRQLEKFGFIQATFAIIALGFGADAVKNQLTLTSKRPQPDSKGRTRG